MVEVGVKRELGMTVVIEGYKAIDLVRIMTVVVP